MVFPRVVNNNWSFGGRSQIGAWSFSQSQNKKIKTVFPIFYSNQSIFSTCYLFTDICKHKITLVCSTILCLNQNDKSSIFFSTFPEVPHDGHWQLQMIEQKLDFHQRHIRSKLRICTSKEALFIVDRVFDNRLKIVDLIASWNCRKNKKQ